MFKSNILLFFITLTLISCESRRVLYISDFKYSKGMKSKVDELIAKLNPTFNMDNIHYGTSKFCYGVEIGNPIFICRRAGGLSLFSFYKLNDPNDPYDLNIFKNHKKNKDEQESFSLHRAIAKKFSDELELKENNYLMDEKKALNKFEYYIAK